ncbi:hypothetical protein [Halobaculum marinum]|uniref:Tat (Twin-arginine translocation) pathway signal sequence n=1 Tax=Halobaculum marinum TaxID=3031996 RepID=A0ABD5WTK7_9EURY|nr:hypothetical protein [Halobaculum sp. DT55]
MNATRRAVLAGVGASAVGGLAGCASSDGGGDRSAPDGTARLAYVRLVNQHSRDHVVHVLVQRGGEPVHWSSHELGADGASDGEATATVERTWADEPGAFAVFVRLDDADEWTEFDVGDGSVDCYGVETRIDVDGGIESLFSKNPGDCGSATASDDA